MNEMTKSMKGVWLTGHGELDKLDVRNDIPVPKLTANDVLIRVGAAAVNNTDINTRTAWSVSYTHLTLPTILHV